MVFWEAYIPAAAHQLDPAFRVARDVDGPGPPCIVVLLAELLVRRFIPHVAAVDADFHTLGPMSTTGIGPTVHFDRAIVDDDRLLHRAHDCG